MNSSSREMIEHTLIIGEFQQLAVPVTGIVGCKIIPRRMQRMTSSEEMPP